MTKRKGISVPEKRIKTTRLKRGSSIWKDPKNLTKDKKDMEKNRPRITTIIPMKSQYATIANAFNSVWRQVGEYDHVILADRGSVDGTNAGMFPEDERVTYVRYPGVNNIEAINFSIVNVVQTKYVLLLDARSTITRGFLDTIRKSLSSSRFVVGTNTATDGLKHVKLPYRNSVTGYAFHKTDAIKAGLFSFKLPGVAPAIFAHKMKKMGIPTEENEMAEILTTYKNLDQNFNADLFNEHKDRFSDYGYLNLDLPPVTFIWIDKQMEFLGDLVHQIRLPEDDFQILNVFSRRKFMEIMKKAKHDTIIVVKAFTDKSLTYDSITNLRLLHQDGKILKSTLERQVDCLAFDRKLVDKPKGDTMEEVFIYIVKKSQKIVEHTKIIEHKGRIKKQEIMKSGVMVFEDSPPSVDILRKKKGDVSIWSGKKGSKVIKKVRKSRRSKIKGGTVSRVGIKHYSMKWKQVGELPGIPGIRTRKPKVMFISDVAGWAWHYKSKKLKEHLSDEFHIDIIWLLGPGHKRIKPRSHDLYVTFGYSYIDYLSKVSPRKKMTGITAHRPHSVLVPQMRKAAVVHANSMMLFRELETMHNIVYYVPNGVDEQLFRPMKEIPLKRDNIVVGHVGKLSMMKGQDKYIKPAIKRAGAVPKFHFNDYTNSIPIEDMPHVYQDMDCFIVASKEDGTPNPALEAAACGRPIISNRIGNMPEFIKDGWNGFLVDKEIGAYVEKIKWLKKNRSKMIEMGENARKTVEKSWTWGMQSENYRQMFKEVLGI